MHDGVTRRAFLRTSAVIAVAMTGPPLLAACGGSGGGSASIAVTTAAASSPATASVTVAAASSAAASSAVSTAAATTSVAVLTSASRAPAVTTAIAAPSVASSGQPASGAVPIRIGSWLVRPTNQAVYDGQLIKPYATVQPRVKLSVEYTEGTSAHLTKMLAETAAGDPPDIVEVNFDVIQDFSEKGALLDLDPLIASSKIDLNNYVKQALELGRYPQRTGKYWAWQTMLAVGVLYYNKTLFDNAGLKYPDETWAYPTTVLDAAQKLTRKGADEASSSWGFNIDYFTRSMLFSYGFQEVSADGKTALVDSPASIEAHQYWFDLVNKYQASFPNSARKTFNVKEGPFETGHLAMSLDGSYETQAWQQIASLDWDIAAPPKGPAGQFSVIKGAPAHGLAPLSKHQDDAWGFLSWWILNETPAQVVNPGNLPSRLVALSDWTAEQRKANPKPANVGVMVDVAGKLGQPLQVPPHSADVWTAYTKARNDILAGKVGVADGLHAAAQQINGILAR